MLKGKGGFAPLVALAAVGGDADRCVLSQPHAQVLLCAVGPTHEGIEQALLDVVLLPDGRLLDANTLLGFSGSLISGAVKNRATSKVRNVLVVKNDGLNQMLLKLSPPNHAPDLTLAPAPGASSLRG